MSTIAHNDTIDDSFLAQIDRILHSDVLRSSDALRRLLKFLSEKYVSGEADNLKEYTIAVDALDRAPSYDPQHDSTVRIQMGRLRQKLAEYYRTEGKEDLTIIDLPRGRFKLALVSRPQIAQTASAPQAVGTISKLFWVCIIFLCILATSSWFAYSFAQKSNGSKGIGNRDLEELWAPFLAANRPLIIAVADPPFVSLARTLVCRDTSIDQWAELDKSSSIGALRKVLDSPGTETHYYAAFGEVGASFLLGRLLGMRTENVSLIRTSQLSRAQFVGNNVVLVGKEDQFSAQLQGMPLKAELMVNADGIQNMYPDPGEPLEFADDLTREPGAEFGQDGEFYALISHLAGPQRDNDILVFTSRNTFAYMGAVQAFTNPAFSLTLASELRRATGKIPRYYQLVLKVRFKDQVPIETTFVLSRALR